ncbi:DUF2812 domain-containing protein [Streptococcus loxodontisalivarius]|uniref:DUF2812 domain-containing protein n=1 Tax=Streptococcus loxodontisalivarius TaxID=1349415 RepID=A0ABS2PUA7_9STRE|nr:DUF2812 domain-containing protein [Streptococcus loxodontisalivarius]MBM7643270.1 hypothetical protein [Streptococcus loxodontisalivarius]
MATKTEVKQFWITDFDEEAAYLREMHQKGWKFVKVRGFFYHFESCQPEDVVYQVDFKGRKNGSKADYLQLFEDYGWEYVTDFNKFSYFRKSAADGDTEIYNDMESKYKMVKRIFRDRFVFSLILYIFALTVTSSDVFPIIVAITFIYFSMVAYVLYRFYQLRKRLKSNL